MFRVAQGGFAVLTGLSCIRSCRDVLHTIYLVPHTLPRSPLGRVLNL